MLTWRERHFFWRCFVSLVKCSYWSKFQVNIIPGSGVMSIFFSKGLTINLEIRNTPTWVLPNIWRLVRVRDTKFGTNVSNKMIVNAAKCQRYSLYHIWVIKGKATGGTYPTPTPTQIRVKQRYITYAKHLKKLISIKTMTWTFLQKYYTVYAYNPINKVTKS